MSGSSLNLIIPVLASIFNLAGLAAFYRATGQNKVDAQNALTDEQDRFRNGLLARVAQVEATNASLLVMLQAQAVQLATITAERDTLKRRVDELATQLHELQGDR